MILRILLLLMLTIIVTRHRQQRGQAANSTRGNTLGRTQAASLNPGPHFPAHRPPNGNGRAGDARPLRLPVHRPPSENDLGVPFLLRLLLRATLAVQGTAGASGNRARRTGSPRREREAPRVALPHEKGLEAAAQGSVGAS